MRVSVVIPHYYQERVENLPVLIDALRSGSVVPDEILIWNNHHPLPPLSASVIQSHKNIGCQGRFLAGLVADADLVVFQDNDVQVERHTIENLVAWSQHFCEAIVSVDGRDVMPGGYRHWPRVRGAHAVMPVQVAVTVGRMEAVQRRLLPSILATFPFQADTVMDDLWFSACATRVAVPIYVVPAGAGAGIRNLAHGGVGMSVVDKSAHYAERTRVWAEIQERQHVA